jgi:serine/threonine protein kinase
MSRPIEDLAVLSRVKGSQQERAMDFQYRSGDQPLSGYTIKRGVGWGGFGEVYYAVSDGGKEVALKLVRRHLDVELRGVRQCLNLKSPNLVNLFDVRETERGENWIVMEFVNGPSLQDRLKDSVGSLPYSETRQWLLGIAQGVDYLHRSGIVHRDLKPGNIFRDDETVKIGDYGLSKFLSVSRRSNQTQSVGTVHYMAPEISTGNYGRGVDIYSTAVIAFEMLAGDVPFDGETPGEVLMKHLTAEPDLARIETRYRPLFVKALAKNPDDRFDSATALFEAVDAVTMGQPIPQSIATQGTPSSLLPTGSSDPRKRDREPSAPVPLRETPPVAAVSMAETMPHRAVGDMQLSIPPLPGTWQAKRREASQFLWQIFLVGLLSSILPAVSLKAWTALDGTYRPTMVEAVALSTVTALSSVGIVALGAIWRRSRTEAAGRHLHSLLFGLALGAAWFSLDLWLLQIEPDLLLTGGLAAVWSERGVDLLGPHLLGYATLCGLTLAIPDWHNAVSADRRSRVNIGWIVWPAVTAFAIGSIIAEIDAYYVSAAMGLTGLIVQWVSPHESILLRRRRQRRQFAGR